MFVSFYYPCKELAEKRKRRVGYDYVGFVTQCGNFGTAEVTVTLEVLPFYIMEIYHAVAAAVVVEDKDFAAYRSFGRVELRCVLLK